MNVHDIAKMINLEIVKEHADDYHFHIVANEENISADQLNAYAEILVKNGFVLQRDLEEDPYEDWELDMQNGYIYEDGIYLMKDGYYLVIREDRLISIGRDEEDEE